MNVWLEDEAELLAPPLPAAAPPMGLAGGWGLKGISVPGALLLALGCTAKVESGRRGEAPLPTVVAQRVTATTKRAASRLVRLESEHDAFLTTPEHPFATLGSGWVSAGRLAPGDWLVSERFGAVRLRSVRNQPATRPLPVFNLSVASSHAYFVGAARILVHNTKCRSNSAESFNAAIEQVTREQEEIERKIQALAATGSASSEIAQLKTQREKIRKKASYLRGAQRKAQGDAGSSREERERQKSEAEHEAARKALEEARRELAALEGRPPSSKAEGSTLAAQKAALEKQLAALTLTYDRTQRILCLLRERAELKQDKPATDADRRAHQMKEQELRANLKRERKRERDLKHLRKKRADPEAREEGSKHDRALGHRLLRTPAYLADTERPRDPLELMEDELASRYQEPPSESRDARIHHLTEQIETTKKLVELRREIRRLKEKRRGARKRREKRLGEGQDTGAIDEKLGQIELELRAVRIEIAQRRVRARLLTLLDATPWAGAPESVDEARLREFERQLAEGIGAGLENEQQLVDIERALDIMDPTHADLQGAPLDEAQDVEEVLSERQGLMRQSPSPGRAAGLDSSYERLRQELREGRAALAAALFGLANEHAHIQTTRAGSSSGSGWEERLRALQEEQGRLSAHWRASLQARLESARRQLELIRLVEAFRDEAIEVELAREIALLEHELQLFS